MLIRKQVLSEINLVQCCMEEPHPATLLLMSIPHCSTTELPSYLWGWQATCTSRAHRQHLLDLLTAALARWRRILHAPVAFQEDVQDWLWDWSSGPFLLPHSARSVSVFGKRQENKQFLRQIWRPLPTRRLKIKLHSPQKRQCVSQRTLTSLKETAQSNRSDSAAFNRSHSQRNWSRPTLSSARHSPFSL